MRFQEESKENRDFLYGQRGFFGFITHSLLSQFIIRLIVGIRSQTVL